jgi:TRAP-type mannitol/chloroaromatic compound transport system permease small subunit
MSATAGALLDRALRAVDRGSALAALAGGWMILAAAALVAVDVVVRKLAAVTVGGADELSGYALAIGSTWSFAFVMVNRGNVRIDALYQHLPRRVAAACDLLAVLALLAFASLVAWHGWGVMSYAWTIGSRSNTSLAVPLAIPLALWWTGYAWFVACGILLLARSVTALAAGDLAAVNRLIGARSVQEEAADEMRIATESLGSRAS